MDREVIDPLLGLLDECVAEDLPSEILGLAVHFLESLIDRDGADRDGGVAQDPLAGGMDVLAGGEIHHCVGTPLGRPAHLLDLFLDGGSDRAVADVRVDLHQEVAADDHRFQLGVVDICGNDRAACGDLGADEFRRDLLGDALGKAAEDRGGVGTAVTLSAAGVLLVEFVAGNVSGEVCELCLLGAAHVLSDGDEFHLRGDDPLTRVPELGDGMSRGRAEGLALAPLEPGELDQAVPLGGAGILGMLAGEVAVVHGLNFTPLVGSDVTALLDPALAQGWKALRGVTVEIGVAPGAAAVIDADGIVRLEFAREVLGGGELDLAHRDADLRMDRSLDIDAGAGGEGVGAGKVCVAGLDVGFGGDHWKKGWID